MMTRQKILHQSLLGGIIMDSRRVQYAVNGILHSVHCAIFRDGGLRLNEILFLAADDQGSEHCEECDGGDCFTHNSLFY